MNVKKPKKITAVVSEKGLRHMLRSRFDLTRDFDVIEHSVLGNYDGSFTDFFFKLIKGESGLFRCAFNHLPNLPQEVQRKVFEELLDDTPDDNSIIRYLTDQSSNELLDVFHSSEVETYIDSLVSKGLDPDLVDWYELFNVYDRFLSAFTVIFLETMKSTYNIESIEGYTIMKFSIHNGVLAITFL